MKSALWMVMCLLVLPAAIWFGLREWQRTKGTKAASAAVAGAAAAAKAANPPPSGVMGNVPQQVQATAVQVAQTVGTVAGAASEVVDVARKFFGGGDAPVPLPDTSGDFADASAFNFDVA